MSLPLQVKLNCLHPGLFPMLHSPSLPSSAATALLPHAVVPRPLPEAGQDVVVEGPTAGHPLLGDPQPSSTAGALLVPPSCYKYTLLPAKIRGGDCKDVDQDLMLDEVGHQQREVSMLGCQC